MFYTELSDRNFAHISTLVYETCGINLHEGKEPLVRARLGKRLRETGFKDFSSYYKFLTDGDTGYELVCMLDSICTNTTSFFREEKHFDFLKQVVFPSYVSGKNGRGSRRLRFWSAACSSGEEPYSLAIWLSEHFVKKNTPLDVKILATDISTKVLAQAKRGVYGGQRLANMPQFFLRKYFQRGYGGQEGSFRVKRSLRDMIEFKRFNLMEPFPFDEPFNLILCRNVMIYFDKDTQQALVNKFYDCIADGGYLLTGHADSLTRIEHGFRYVRPSVYQKQ